MGLSLSAAAAIIFSGIILMSADYIITTDTVSTEVARAMEEHDEISASRLSTQMEVVEVNRSATVLWVNISNEGSTVLNPGDAEVLLDGDIATEDIQWNISGVQGHQGSSIWAPGEQLNLAIDTTADPQRVIVIAPNGVSVVHVRS